MDCSLPGSSVHGILQAGILEWVAIPFSRVSSQTQELNLGLLHHRQILYQLSYQGSHTSQTEDSESWLKACLLKPDFLCGNSGTNDLQRSRPSLKSHAVSQLPHFWLKQCDSPSTFKGKEFRPSRELASLIAQLVKNLPAIWETWVQSLDWEDPLEEGMATHSSILPWRIPWTV